MWSLHSSIHSFIQKLFIECLPWTKKCFYSMLLPIINYTYITNTGKNIEAFISLPSKINACTNIKSLCCIHATNIMCHYTSKKKKESIQQYYQYCMSLQVYSMFLCTPCLFTCTPAHPSWVWYTVEMGCRL